MEYTTLGRTGLSVSRTSFGALPIQRVSFDEAKALLLHAYENGVNFFDTARAYTDSEEKIGYALSGVRQRIVIATKTHAKTRTELFAHLEQSLRALKTDYIDIYQLHNPPAEPDYDDPDSLYGGLLEAKQKGYIRFLGITNHRMRVARNAVESGRWDTLQFPFSSLASPEEVKLAELCGARGVGFIAMKAMSGGLIRHPAGSFAFLRQYPQVVPIWGVQRMAELDEFLGYEAHPPVLDAALQAQIDEDRQALSGSFCRGCGYCQPCPAGIPIETAARISLLLTRAPYRPYLTDEFKEQMERVEACIHCGHCTSHCPYRLDTPALLRQMLTFYRDFYEAHRAEVGK